MDTPLHQYSSLPKIPTVHVSISITVSGLILPRVNSNKKIILWRDLSPVLQLKSCVEPEGCVCPPQGSHTNVLALLTPNTATHLFVYQVKTITCKSSCFFYHTNNLVRFIRYEDTLVEQILIVCLKFIQYSDVYRCLYLYHLIKSITYRPLRYSSHFNRIDNL